jgi:hypothetical protein
MLAFVYRSGTSLTVFTVPGSGAARNRLPGGPADGAGDRYAPENLRSRQELARADP